MDVLLAVVQARIEPEAYRSSEAFTRRTLELARQAVRADGPPAAARVIAFPEAYALPLIFWLETPAAVVEAPSALKAALQLLGTILPAKPFSFLRHTPPGLLYRERLLAVWPTYTRAFSRAARETGSYLIAGSIFGPPLDEEPVQGLHPQNSANHNWLAVFTPSGRILARVPKMRLVAEERKAFLHPGRFGPHVVETRLGKIGVLICLDAFHESLVERIDGSGAWLLVQPSANAAAWEGPWSADPGQREGEVWLREGLAGKLAGRENLRYGMNPMLNGKFYETTFEGRSSIAAPGRILALAGSPVGDEIVRITVERPAGAR